MVFAEVLPHDVGSVFGLYVAVPDAIRVDYHGRAGAFFAVFAPVKATARLHAGFVLFAARKQRLQSLLLQLDFQCPRDIFADFGFLSITNKQVNH